LIHLFFLKSNILMRISSSSSSSLSTSRIVMRAFYRQCGKICIKLLIYVSCLVFIYTAAFIMIMLPSRPQFSNSAALKLLQDRLQRHANYSAICENSRQGMRWIADSKGRVCLRNQIDQGGCCIQEKEEENACSSRNCLIDSMCCSTLEHCTACCMQSQQDRDKSRPKEFYECLGKCRTSQKILIHGNRYKSVFKHCFGRDIVPKEVENIDHVEFIASDHPGESCSHVCGEHDKVCVPYYLKYLSCSRMKSQFLCSSCSTDSRFDRPSLDLHNSLEMKTQNKYSGKCILASDTVEMDCDVASPLSVRICSCVNRPK
jgi:hypothetical protein